MKHCLFGIYLLALPFCSQAQTGNTISLGTIRSIESKILKEKRDIWIYVPNSSQPGIYSKTKYPVVYLLDGEAHFYSVVGLTHQLSSVNGNTLCPEMIVVGITNTDRLRDLTPTHVAMDPVSKDSNAFRNSGGGENFISFIKNELVPFVDSAYPTLPYRTFIGHSLGGLIVLQTLMKHKDLFNAYIAIDPSMWWDSRHLLNAMRNGLLNQNFKDRQLYLGIANTMDAGMDTLKVNGDTSMATDHIRSILTLNRLLQTNTRNNLAYSYNYYNNDTHGSVPLISTYDALRSIFSFYDFRMGTADYMNFSMETIAKLENHFKNVSAKFGFDFPVPEGLANQFGYLALSEKKMKEAGYLFNLNVKNYPASANVYDSLGDFYAATTDNEKAEKAYEKALSIHESAHTRQKLNELIKK